MRVLKWSVPIDDEPHPAGGGPVMMVGAQAGSPNHVQVWTLEPDDDGDVATPRQVQVYATGQYVPEPAGPALPHWPPGTPVDLGSCVTSADLAWHVFVVDDERWTKQTGER